MAPGSPPRWVSRVMNRPSLTRRNVPERFNSQNFPDFSSSSDGSFANQDRVLPKIGPRVKSGMAKAGVDTNFIDNKLILIPRLHRQSILFLLCHLFGIAVSVYVFHWAKNSHEEQRRVNLETICNDRTWILSGLFKKNTNHVRTFQAFIDTLNRSAYTNIPARLPVFGKGLAPCQLHIVPRIEEEAVAQYLDETLYARPMVLRLGYGAFVPHRNRREFEECMGFTISDWHTQEPSPPRMDYFVRTHGSNLTYVTGFDMSSMSDQHVVLWQRVKETDSIAISPPYVMLTSKERKMGMGVAFPSRSAQLTPNASIEEMRQATIGCSAATIDFESMVDKVLEDLQQGRMFDVVMRIDDVTDIRHPVTLYEPSSLNSSSTREGLKPPLMLTSKNSYPTFIPDSWKFREDIEDDDVKSSKWLVTSLNLGDATRKHEVRCRYKEEHQFPKLAVILALGSLAICLLLLQIILGAVKRFEQMREGYYRMSILKQAAEAGNTAKSVFLAAMTQEVRSPMQAMLGMINLLLKTNLDPLQLDYARTAEASGKALIYLINDVLDYAKIESGNFKLENVPFNIRFLVDDVLSMLSPIAQEKKGRVELAALVFDSVPTFLVGDPARLRQVLASIIGNALKFTEYGHVFLTVHLSHERPRSSWLRKQTSSSSSLDSAGSISPQTSLSASPSPSPPTSPFQSAEYLPGTLPPSYKTQDWGGLFHTLSGREAADTGCSWEAVCRTAQDDEKRQLLKEKTDREAADHGLVPVRRKVKLEFKVEDTGIGIPENAREHIYLPFAQLDPSLQRRYGGTGIGLSLAQRLIHLMGGGIDFVSRLRVGTTFKFDVKVDVLDRLIGNPKVESLPEEQLAKLKGKKALVVDGRQVRQQVLASCLHRLGLQVELCDNIFSATVAIQESIIHDSAQKTVAGKKEYKEGWDVVLVDEDAGGAGSGIDLGKLLVRACETKNIQNWNSLLPKLILVSCGDDDVESSETTVGPFSGTLIKPVRCTGLAACLTEVLGSGRNFSNELDSRTRNDQSLRTLVRAVKRKKILVVDGDFDTQDAVSTALMKAETGAVVCVSDCVEALQLLEESGPFDCVLVNVSLQAIDGFELARRIRALERDAVKPSPQTPIIALVSEATRGCSFECEMAGIDGCIMTPVIEEALANALVDVMYEKQGETRNSPPRSVDHASLKGWLPQW